MRIFGLLIMVWCSTLHAGGYRYIPAENFGLEESYDTGETPVPNCPGRKIGKSISSDLIAVQDAKATLAVVIENRNGEIKYVALRKKESLDTTNTALDADRLLLGYIILDPGSNKKKPFKIPLPQAAYNVSLVSDVIVLGLKFDIIQRKKSSYLKATPQKY